MKSWFQGFWYFHIWFSTWGKICCALSNDQKHGTPYLCGFMWVVCSSDTKRWSLVKSEYLRYIVHPCLWWYSWQYNIWFAMHTWRITPHPMLPQLRGRASPSERTLHLILSRSIFVLCQMVHAFRGLVRTWAEAAGIFVSTPGRRQ